MSFYIVYMSVWSERERQIFGKKPWGYGESQKKIDVYYQIYYPRLMKIGIDRGRGSCARSLPVKKESDVIQTKSRSELDFWTLIQWHILLWYLLITWIFNKWGLFDDMGAMVLVVKFPEKRRGSNKMGGVYLDIHKMRY